MNWHEIAYASIKPPTRTQLLYLRDLLRRVKRLGKDYLSGGLAKFESVTDVDDLVDLAEEDLVTRGMVSLEIARLQSVMNGKQELAKIGGLGARQLQIEEGG